ncbi:MAG: 3'-5' exonuclease [Bacillota bacterium]|nr:3'-5' exonuclease [Bacillota bacterium]
MEDYLKKLNKNQYEAATTVKGPLLILAGAGSGKTNTMTHRIAYMIKDCNISPYSILAVTFTNKAAKEMLTRVENIIGTVRGMWIQTFHSACLRILRSEADLIGYSKNFVVYDSVDQKSVIKSIAKDLNLDEKRYTPNYLLGKISAAKEKELDSAAFRKIYANTDPELCRVYDAYELVLRKNNAMDFDDLILNAVKLFESSKGTLAKYQDHFEYIMVDEYQDTNMLQYKLIKMLAEKNNNICVVGDDDQCIYQWRGADIRNILEFERDFSGAKVIKLEQNYRSTANIINAANSVIVKNESRKDKKMKTDAEAGDKIEYYRADTDIEEARWTTEKIRAFMRKNPDLKYSDFAILYRNNVQSRRFEDSLAAKSIPYQVLSGMRYYDRKEVKDMLAYMRLVVNPADDVSLLRIINTPRRGIGKKTVEDLIEFAKTNNVSLFEAMTFKGVATILTDLYKSLEVEKDRMTVDEIYNTLLDRTGYIAALQNVNTVEAESRIENLLDFKTVILEKQKEADEAGEDLTLDNFMEGLALISDVDNHDPNQDAVTLMTLHSAKGLEFPIVFMPGMETGLFPSYRSFDRIGGVEEERRLCYVGMTRAMKSLLMSSAERRTMYGRTEMSLESQFLKEIDKKYLTGHALYEKKMSRQVDYYDTSRSFSSSNYVSPIAIINQMKAAKPKRNTLANVEVQPGDKVDHIKFGVGTVLDVDGNILTVQFEEGSKKLAKDMAPLTKVE